MNVCTFTELLLCASGASWGPCPPQQGGGLLMGHRGETSILCMNNFTVVCGKDASQSHDHRTHVCVCMPERVCM